MQGNVKEPRFGVDFFRRFDCVLNGLDNLEARRHINRLCLAAGVPLVESGTAGYLGQVNLCGVHYCLARVLQQHPGLPSSRQGCMRTADRSVS